MVRGDPREVLVRRQHRQLVPDAELSKESVDGADLDAPAPACRANVGSSDVVVAIRHEQRESGESVDDPFAGPGAAEALEQLLEDEPGRHDLLSVFERPGESVDGGKRRRPVAPKRERPDARLDEQRQARERSAL